MTATASFYAKFFKGWQTKVLGPVPTADQLNVAHGLGLRQGKQALANAMYLRDGGASSPQVVMATGAPQLNRMRGLVSGGFFKRDMTVPANEQGHTVYKVTLTARGQAVLDRTARAAEKAALTGATEAPAPTKGKVKKAAKKARKAAGKAAMKAATTPTVDAPSTAPDATVETVAGPYSNLADAPATADTETVS